MRGLSFEKRQLGRSVRKLERHLILQKSGIHYEIELTQTYLQFNFFESLLN